MTEEKREPDYSWIQTARLETLREARDVLEDVLRQMDLLSDSVIIPPWPRGREAWSVDETSELTEERMQVVSMLVRRQVFGFARHYYNRGPYAFGRDREGIAIEADRSIVEAALREIDNRLSPDASPTQSEVPLPSPESPRSNPMSDVVSETHVKERVRLPYVVVAALLILALSALGKLGWDWGIKHLRPRATKTSSDERVAPDSALRNSATITSPSAPTVRREMRQGRSLSYVEPPYARFRISGLHKQPLEFAAPDDSLVCDAILEPRDIPNGNWRTTARATPILDIETYSATARPVDTFSIRGQWIEPEMERAVFRIGRDVLGWNLRLRTRVAASDHDRYPKIYGDRADGGDPNRWKMRLQIDKSGTVKVKGWSTYNPHAGGGA